MMYASCGSNFATASILRELISALMNPAHYPARPLRIFELIRLANSAHAEYRSRALLEGIEITGIEASVVTRAPWCRLCSMTAKQHCCQQGCCDHDCAHERLLRSKCAVIQNLLRVDDRSVVGQMLNASSSIRPIPITRITNATGS